MLTLYGIKNCDSVKKARTWLEQQAIPYQFHDFRSDGLTAGQLQDFIARSNWEALLNRRSTTWKQLSETERNSVNTDTIVSLLLTQPTLIKRPLLDNGKELLIGFAPQAYQQVLQQLG